MTKQKINDNSIFSLLQMWLKHLSFNVLKRSTVIALIIGSILTLANQPSAVFDHAPLKTLPLMLAFITPFFVITFSQLGAIQQAAIDRSHKTSFNKSASFINTMMNHNILYRATVIALFAGSLNAVVILTEAYFQTDLSISSALSLLIQPYMLPFLFGAFSQTLTYRRSVVQ